MLRNAEKAVSSAKTIEVKDTLVKRSITFQWKKKVGIRSVYGKFHSEKQKL